MTSHDKPEEAGAGAIPDDLVTISEAARAYDIPVATIRYWVRVKRIRSWKLRGFWVYISRADIERMNRLELVDGEGQ